MSSARRGSEATVAVVGGGPAGLMACEVLAQLGATVTLFDRMPSVGRKLLLAGRGGLNLTHSEPFEDFLARYGAARPTLEPALRRFDNDALAAWADGLGQSCFVGSSGRVFPAAFRATPLLRAWLARLAVLDVRIETGWRFEGWDEAGLLRFIHRSGSPSRLVSAGATVLALGGGSWPRTGSDGSWVDVVRGEGVAVEPLAASNCGVRVAWSAGFLDRFAGRPLKNISVSAAGAHARGEALVTATGLEGGAVYQLIPALRSELALSGIASLTVDLKPQDSLARLTERFERRRSRDSLATALRRQGGLTSVAVALLRESTARLPLDSSALARLCKAVPVAVSALAPMDRAISVAGGIRLAEIDETFMVRRLPGVFVAGEMLDWEAPTGGYLLQGCLSTGAAAGKGAAVWLGLSR